ncbi:hypothetical protein FHR75_001787 [Kineococcus radiotolerans]|uniref:SnoaL-like domain-containing protein n=2 Tax=Kineococcus radiotolerans TaxID=131568 RepID=A6W4W8_KINRD|nr:nuclear transport factor 2 family protein [Kineococcus radiotolerans]ABS01857.1 hypothetical protein Krad_0367 [Kineococcus radiotolerans SRS30216 = ATCC BAA-149]MBB2900999.1 hypothetical protein [Kineococcus radiotolerans]
MSVEDLMRANLLDVFGERDPGRRRAAAERTYTADVRFSDPDETVLGQRALLDKAQRLLDDAPGFVFSPDGPVRVAQDLGYLAWGFGPEGGEPVVRGIDVALVVDGRISRVYTLLT